MKRYALIVVSLFIAFNSYSQDTVRVVFLAGQSNMGGSGLYQQLSQKDKDYVERVAHRVLFSNKGSVPSPLSYTYSEYYKNKLGFAEVFGPELFLGVTMGLAKPHTRFLFIKLAQGGTSLYGAWNPVWSEKKANYAEDKEFKKKLKLYDLHQQQISNTLESLKEKGIPYKIMGMVWMQGENDAAKELCAKDYENNLKKLIEGYRYKFHVPHMPFVMGQINSSYGDFPQGPNLVRMAMRKVANDDMFCDIILTSTDKRWLDYPKHSDNVHYNTEGQKRLGKAMAEKLLHLVKEF